jgi:hypothetical protein
VCSLDMHIGGTRGEFEHRMKNYIVREYTRECRKFPGDIMAWNGGGLQPK